MFDKEAIQELSKAEAITAAATALRQDDNGGLAALPSDFALHDLEKFAENRRRMRGTMETSIVADFARYTDLNAEVGACVFVDQASMKAVAVLNMGEPDEPGHADNVAVYKAKATAAFTALGAVAHGRGLTQQQVAEFLEDWQPLIQCEREGEVVATPKAIAAVRKITIEALKKLESTEQQLSASRSAFEKVEATSTEPLPTLILFTTVPYVGLAARSFALRLGILTGDKAPSITLRIANAERHAEEMATELANLVREAIGDDTPVMVGTYSAKA